MAILASLFGVVGRFAGKLVNASLGWATILLFGRVPKSKQILLSVVTLGSIAWVVSILGVVFPDLGTFLIALVPAPKFIDRGLLRLAMFVIALVLPILVGIAALFVVSKEDRPSGMGRVWAVLRGYLFCAVLAVMLVFLAAIALVRKGRAIVKRWEDAHVAIVVKPGEYEGVVRALDQSLDSAGLGLTTVPAPRVLALPAHILAAAAGSGVRSLVPDRLMELKSRSLEVLVYPSDIAIAGTKDEVSRARAAVASRLTTAPAYLTTTEEAQKVEDRIEGVANEGRRLQEAGRAAPGSSEVRELRRRLDAIDETLAGLVVPYDEWEVLYRMRLQVDRELMAGEKPGETLGAGQQPGSAGASTPGPEAGRQAPRGQGFGPARLQWGASLLGIALIATDVVLTIADRISPPGERPAGLAERLTGRRK